MAKVKVEGLLTAAEVAELLGIDSGTVSESMRAGHYPGHLFRQVYIGKKPIYLFHPRAVFYRLENMKPERWPEWYRVQVSEHEEGKEWWLPTSENLQTHRGLDTNPAGLRKIPRVSMVTKLVNGQTIDPAKLTMEPEDIPAQESIQEEPEEQDQELPVGRLGKDVENLAAVKAKLEKVKLQKAEQELAVAQNKLLPVEVVGELLQSVAVAVRQAVLAIPPRCGPVLAAEMDQHKTITYLDKELRAALEGLAQLEQYMDGVK